jgi:hypothetical protein
MKDRATPTPSNVPSENPRCADLHEEILRIIGNVKQEHNSCVLARGRYGLAEFGRLAGLLKEVSDEALNEYLDRIDAVEESHTCFLCSMKLIAFNAFFCGERLRERGRFYKEFYDQQMEGSSLDRDFMREVEQVIWAAANPHPRPKVELAPLDGD